MARVLVIISSDNLAKALTGLMWATNALKYGWVDDVEVIFFGPVERLIAEGNQELIKSILEYSRVKGRPLACKRIAEVEGYADKLEDKVEVVYVGSVIGKYINDGYTPLVF